MIDRTKFLEPTETYKTDSYHRNRTPEIIKDWFNVDLIFWAIQYKYETKLSIIETAFSQWTTFCDFKLTLKEVVEIFKDYPKEDFDELVRYLIKHDFELKKSEPKDSI